MRRALDLAAEAASRGEVPVGAVILRDGRLVAESGNAMSASRDSIAHAEMLAIRSALARSETGRLDGCDLWVTLEPCAMCAGAIALARIARVYFAAPDPKGGAILHGPRLFDQPTCHHRPEIYSGMGEARAATLLREFFLLRR